MYPQKLANNMKKVGQICGNGKHSECLLQRPPFTHSLTSWSKALEKPTGSQLLKKLSTFYGTRKLITVCVSANHLSLS
jgi:hypothetical protein